MLRPLRWIHQHGFLGLSLGSMLLSVVTAQPQSSSPVPPLALGTYHLMVTERAVSLEAREASVATILADIGQRTGIQMVVYPGVDARITIQLTQVALDEALKRLAPNSVIVPAQGVNAPPHRIAKVYVLAAGQGRPPQVEDSATRPQAETANNAAPRPAPFQFTFDPSQHLKRSQ